VESFDVASRIWTLTTPAGRVSTRTVDAAGRTIAEAVAGLTPTTLLRDAQGRLSTETRGTRTTSYGYGTDGLLASVTDALSHQSLIGRDGAGRVVTMTRPDGESTSLGYAPKGNTLSVTPPGQPAHGFTYTPVDLLASYLPPDAGFSPRETQYSYDLDRNLTLLTQPDGKTLSYGFDTAGRASTVTAPSAVRTRAYDLVTGMLSSIAAPGVTLGFGYDGTLLAEMTWTGDVNGSVAFSYDNDFRVTTQKVNDVNPVGLSYDLDGLQTGAGSLTVTRSAQNGLVTGTSLGQVTDSYTLTGYGELGGYEASFAGNPIYSLVFERDALGRITKKTETVAGVPTAYEYAYDLAGRLAQVKTDGQLTGSYSYDPNGNRLSHTGPLGTRGGSYDAQDRLLSYGPLDFGYGNDGDLVSRVDTSTSATTLYAYDVFGALGTVTLPSGSVVEYLHDGLNHRIQKKLDGNVVKAWLYQDDLRPIAELDAAGNVVERFVYALGRNVPDYLVKGASSYRILTDQVGSVRLVVDVATGAIAQRIDYDEFGVVLSDSAPGLQPFGFGGGLYDPDTGLVRFGARDYLAEVGRWTSKDPVRFAGKDSNLYGYVLADPVNHVDPSGRIWWDIIFELFECIVDPDSCPGGSGDPSKDEEGAEGGEGSGPGVDLPPPEPDDANICEPPRSPASEKSRRCRDRANAAYQACRADGHSIKTCSAVWAIVYRYCMAEPDPT
jgi:RHS repeat-associated protein